ncbi:UNVERIFIED_CONTAM: hypothetical protein RKD43_007330 [Streptomyces graminofaciens]
MTAWHTTTGTTTIDPYRFPGATDDYLLPAPRPGQRVPLPLEPADRRRLDLHAALTTAGIAPLPGDLAAIDALCALDDTTHAALQRWITRKT